ncbi:sugar ABC transporter ATP-binding protein [Crassaminicella profunda]|uniref:sugar ABC transporter ATP-binding protein n=1 Tax=Crassaminicella profunda TaxID=1286698 RepID=UPI001CA74ECB|nr:sugar ABC transporter ATP-binding protein [Crassaminicella profunda]QZY56296.1 sugar ABC transporter ATP-binding protein [Crassaminicella profunda]
MTSDYVLQMKNIKKEYFGNKVLKGVSISVKPGEIHALLGENGAGKSTLMNVLFGMPVIHSTGGFEGEVVINGETVNVKSPKEAMGIGIGMVHQEFMLVPGFSLTENIKLNREITKTNPISKLVGESLNVLDTKRMKKDARKALDTLGMDIEEWVKVAGLPVGYMQFVEIAREIDKSNVKLLVFDEPTAVLTESEADNLIESMKKIAASGIAILFITHRLDEVMEAADNVTILRDGELAAIRKKEETNVGELAELMVGRKIEVTNKSEDTNKNFENLETILSMKNFKVNMPGEEVKGINLDIKKGEILGIGGLAGQGKIGIANGIMGLYESSGEVSLKGNKLKLNDTRYALKSGLAFVSEDRRGIGLLLDSSIEHNIVVTTMQVQEKFLKKIAFFDQLDRKKIRKHALKMIEDLDIRCTGSMQITRRLSGGNQQKVCIARALTLEPDILFVSEPTRGIDIGAKKLVLDLLVKLNKELGMTIVMTSSELAELRAICDRIAIISEGEVEGIVSPFASDRDFGLMMAGEYRKMHSKEAL